MAAVAGNQIMLMFSDSVTDRTALFALRDVTTGDTVNLGQWFTAVKQNILLGTTVAGTGVGTISGTTVTLPAGLSGDACWMLAWGPSA